MTQTAILCFFLFLLIESRLPQDVYQDYSAAFSTEQDLRLKLPVTFFFQLDPLVGLTSLLSGYRLIDGFLWAFGIVLLTVLIGRAFCGFICPFGTIHHAAGWFKPALKGDRMVQVNKKKASQRLKYFLLIALLVAAIFGLNVAGLLDPIALLFRSVALAVLPGLGVGIRSLFEAMAGSDIKFINLLSYAAEVLVAPVFGYSNPA